MNALKPILESWKTSVAGVVGLLFAGLAVLREGVAIMNDPTWQSVVVLSIGLLVAKDHEKPHQPR